MPCFTDGYPPTREELLDAMAPAMLCALISAMDQAQFENLLRRVNWTEAGVTPAQFDEWHQIHAAKDQQRRLRESEQARQQRLAAEARAALTPEQLAALKAEGI